MKIACLIKPEPPLNYLVNRIHAEHDVGLVIVEQSKIRTRDLLLKCAEYGVVCFTRLLLRFVKNRLFKKNIFEEYSEYFGDRWQELDEGIPKLEVENINSEAVISRLKEFQPDLLLVHGTSLVSKGVIGQAELALNLHWGLSPYYRGTHCTEWALINWDPYNIGVTIHKLSKIIDGGEILAQKRAEIKPQHSLNAINMQLTYLGAELLVSIIHKLNAGDNLDYYSQDLSAGHIYNLRQWGIYIQFEVERLIKQGLLADMLRKPSRKVKLPIIEIR